MNWFFNLNSFLIQYPYVNRKRFYEQNLIQKESMNGSTGWERFIGLALGFHSEIEASRRRPIVGEAVPSPSAYK